MGAATKKDTLPETIEGVDSELASIVGALPLATARSRELFLVRADRLLDRRLLLEEVVHDRESAS